MIFKTMLSIHMRYSKPNEEFQTPLFDRYIINLFNKRLYKMNRLKVDLVIVIDIYVVTV